MSQRNEQLLALAHEHRHDGDLAKALGNEDAQDESTESTGETPEPYDPASEDAKGTDQYPSE